MDGTIDKYKDRHVIKGYKQQKGLDYLDTYSLVTRITSIRMTFAIAAMHCFHINNVLKRKDITIDNADQEIELIKARICSIKVLVVIDDLDKLEPLKYLEGSFALGSVVIITTRYEDLLDKIQVKAKYKVNQMDEDDSLQLFTQHAFRKDGIPDTFTELSNKVLKHAGGLSLALRIFGSTLHAKLENKWEWFIEQLKEAPIKDIEKNLMISFDALKSGADTSLRKIFLDIALLWIPEDTKTMLNNHKVIS
ncbi:disease resistance protein Roq1 [Apium graveolens]|uniref:disease resistance protein Roq1 n=1 Tax=Apium graveolens TaxID=4045 RepID=UPI003D7B704C